MNETLADGRRPLTVVGVPTGYSAPSLSLRDYFAGQAMLAVIPHSVWSDDTRIAADCYALADAMVQARGRR